MNEWWCAEQSALSFDNVHTDIYTDRKFTFVLKPILAYYDTMHYAIRHGCSCRPQLSQQKHAVVNKEINRIKSTRHQCGNGYEYAYVHLPNHKQSCAISYFNHRHCSSCWIHCCAFWCTSQLAKSSMSLLEVLDSLLQLLVCSDSLGIMHEVNQADVWLRVQAISDDAGQRLCNLQNVQHAISSAASLQMALTVPM